MKIKIVLTWLLFLSCFFTARPLQAVFSPLPGVTISAPSSNEPQVAMDSAGNAIAIWQEFDGTNTNIQASVLLKGSTWMTPVIIGSSVGNNNETPQIAVDPTGNAVAVWSDPTTTTIKASTLNGSSIPLGGVWSPPLDISMPSSVPALIPQVAIDPAGYAVAVWIRFDEVENRAEAATHPLGGNWSVPVIISTIVEDVFFVDIAIDASGNAVATWVLQQFPNFLIRSAILPFGGSWSAPVTVSDPLENVNQPDLSMSPSGYAVVDWQNFTGPDVVINAATMQFGGGWSAPVTISNPGSNSFEADIIVDVMNNATAMWTQNIGADFIVMSSTLPFGGTWSVPVSVSTPGAFSTNTDMGVDAAGNVIAVWVRDDGIQAVIQAAMLPFGGSWSSPIDLSTAGQHSDQPQIAVDPTGYAVVVWTNETLSVIQSLQSIPPPTVTNVNPNTGSTAGGNSVIITGTNFINVTSVKFGSLNALSLLSFHQHPLLQQPLQELQVLLISQ